jgi:predicted nucleic acid-binding protein
LLAEKFKRVYIPNAVWQEVVESGEGEPGSQAVKDAKWIEVRNPGNENLIKALTELVDIGESEVIALALEMKAEFLLMDEKEARALARKYGFNVLGTVGILIWAKKTGRIKSLRDELDKLITIGDFRLSDTLYKYALDEVGE